MDTNEHGRYERLRRKRAHLLATKIFGNRDAKERKDPSDTELALMEEQRIGTLVASRRQREATLVADYGSDEIYDMEDESRFGILRALRESRERIELFCKGGKNADTVEIIVEGLIRELENVLTSCSLYVGLLQPGKRVVRIIGTTDKMLGSPPILVRGGKKLSTGRVALNQLESDALRDTSSGEGNIPLDAEKMFDCIDKGCPVVDGILTSLNPNDRQGENSNDSPESDKPIASNRQGKKEDMQKLVHIDEGGSESNEGHQRRDEELHSHNGGKTTAEEIGKPTLEKKGKYSSFVDMSVTEDKSRDSGIQLSTACEKTFPKENCDASIKYNCNINDSVSSRGLLPTAAPITIEEVPLQPPWDKPEATTFSRPLVWVPLAGVGDADCIGVLGARGFSSGFTVADESWRKWCAVRMAPVEGGDPLEAKQVRLIRQRALPEQGRVGDIPAGTASKVVYGHIARVTRKRVLLFTIK